MSSPVSGIWSAHQLAEFVASVSDQGDLNSAIHAALDHLCEAFDAEFSAIVEDDRILGTIGLGTVGSGLFTPVADEVVHGTRTTIDIPGAGTCTTIVAVHQLDGATTHVVVARQSPDSYSGEERHLLRNMARVLGMSLRTFRLVESLRERQRLLERLSIIQRSISRRAGLDNVLSAVIAGAVELLDADSALIRLRDPEHPHEHVLVASHGLDERQISRMKRVPAVFGITGRALQAGSLVVEHREGAPARAGAAATASRLMMAAPIHDAGTNVGAIMVAFHDPARPDLSEGEREALSLFAEHASIALTDARAIEAMERAMYDPLTRLPNRVLFRDRLATARAARDRVTTPAVLFVDLDGFKRINDSMGHHAGDELLTDVSLRLSCLVRPGDLVARHGGDEFTVLLQAIESVLEAESVARRIISGLEDPFTVGGHQCHIGASIGIAIDAGDDQADLVAQADYAMYAAKQAGRGRFAVFNATRITQNMDSWLPSL